MNGEFYIEQEIWKSNKSKYPYGEEIVIVSETITGAETYRTKSIISKGVLYQVTNMEIWQLFMRRWTRKLYFDRNNKQITETLKTFNTV